MTNKEKMSLSGEIRPRPGKRVKKKIYLRRLRLYQEGKKKNDRKSRSSSRGGEITCLKGEVQWANEA